MSRKELYAWRTDPDVTHDWQERGFAAAKAKAAKRDKNMLRKQERDAAAKNNLVQVFPEYVTPVKIRNRQHVEPSSLVTTPLKIEKKKKNGSWKKKRDAVIDAAHGMCMIRISRLCDLAATQVHHILPREHGGSSYHTNLIATCRHCHKHVHMYQDEAIEKGFLKEPPEVLETDYEQYQEKIQTSQSSLQ